MEAVMRADVLMDLLSEKHEECLHLRAAIKAAQDRVAEPENGAGPVACQGPGMIAAPCAENSNPGDGA
jgi:hypothetical protein